MSSSDSNPTAMHATVPDSTIPNAAVRRPAPHRSDVPWSHRCNVFVRCLITLLSAIAAGALGTLAHRMGASSNIPYGLVLAFILIGASAWCARSRGGVLGLALHLSVSYLTVWWLAMPGPGGDLMLPIGFHSTTMPWWSQHVGYIWLYGSLIVQVLLLVCPARWFRIGGKDE
ncbi:alcohol dehydrogenase [Bifidobacterium anseris]|nr:alcohol dehydrogenase [Bifidobacterium anseris]